MLNRQWETILLLAITLLAAFLRFYRLDVLPPGDGYDVAQYGVDALEILDGARPIFLETNFGREVLFSYLVALVFLFMGPGTFAIHLASAIVGTLTIPAVYLAARELPDRSKRLAVSSKQWAYFPLLAAFLTAISYWHLNFSRVGLRVILVPFLAALIFFFLWRGLRINRRPDFVATGLLLGLSLYTYQAARLLPLLVLFAFVLWLLAERRFGWADLINLLLTFGLAALVFVPMGLYAWQHPGALSVRSGQAILINPERPLLEQAPTLLGQSTAALLMYNFRGDDEPMFTIAGRPSLNPFLSIAFFIGIVFSLWRWRRPGYLFLLGWLVAMTAPAMIASQAATAKRALGAFPAAVLLISVGIAWAWQVVGEQGSGVGRRVPRDNVGAEEQRRSWQAAGRRWQGWIITVVLVSGLIYSAAVTWRDYFVVWANDPDLPAHFQVDHAEIGAYIGRLGPEETVFLSPYLAGQPVIQLHSGRHPNIRGYNGRYCLPYPDGDAIAATTYVIVPGFEDRSLDQLLADFPEGKLQSGPLRPGSDRSYFNAFQIQPGARPVSRPTHLAGIHWDDAIALTGYNMEPTALRPGDTLTLTLYYEALEETQINYTTFVHLLGDLNPETGNRLWSQSDSEPCRGGLPTSNWRAGETIRDTITLSIPHHAPPGEYQLVTGFYTWPDLNRLPIISADRPAAEQGAILQTIHVE